MKDVIIYSSQKTPIEEKKTPCRKNVSSKKILSECQETGEENPRQKANRIRKEQAEEELEKLLEEGRRKLENRIKKFGLLH